MEISCNNFKLVARALTIVENNLNGSAELLKSLSYMKHVPVVGVTGPPGAGKSTLVNGIINELVNQNLKVAVLAIDPTSPFNFGSLLGDRIRMVHHFNNPNVYIRSLATRGSLGGLSVKTIEMTEVLKAAGFDYIIVETVGVGQSEVEIAGLADLTMVVLVPGSGDEIQNIKSGLMEIANAFVVNKADRPGAEEFINNLKKLTHHHTPPIPVFRAEATANVGITALVDFIKSFKVDQSLRKPFLLTEKAYHLIQEKQMAAIDKKKLQQAIATALKEDNDFNIYRFADQYLNKQVRNS
jgi:LAO/AO transport system kinase